MSETAVLYKRHRFPAPMIADAVRLYLRFSLSLRAVEELLLERGVEVSYESLRRWVKFGPTIAARSGRVWHLDEVQVSVRGQRFWLRRAVDEYGVVLEGPAAASGCQAVAATSHEEDRPSSEALVTDKLRSCAAAKREFSRPRTPGPQGAQQPRREQPSAVPITWEADATAPLAGWPAALRVDALGGA